MINPSEINLSALPSVALEAKSAFPRQPSIYFAIDSLGTVQYVGRSVDPKIRWAGHHRFGQLTAIGQVRIAYLFVDSPELLPGIEAALIDWFDPPLNVMGRRDLNQVATDKRVPGIADLRDKAGLTQLELAQAVGVTESTISNWEKGRNSLVWFERVAKLCKKLNCTPEDLIGYAVTESVAKGVK